MVPDYSSILTPEAIRFIAGLERAFRARRSLLLSRRDERQAQIDAGLMPGFPAETAGIRGRGMASCPYPTRSTKAMG